MRLNVFSLLSSRGTTIVLLLVLVALASAGLFVPQEVAEATIRASYPASASQVMIGLGLHHILRSWMLQLALVLLALNLMGRLLVRVMNLTDGRPARPADLSRAPVPGPDESRRIDVVLRELLPKWTVQLQAAGRARAFRGLAQEGTVILVLGALVLGGAYTYSEMAGERGTLQLLEGDDQTARARARFQRLEGDTLVPWRPGFTMRCMPAADGTATGARQCLLDVEGQALQATLQPGRDLEFEGYRVSLVGIGRQPHVAGFAVDVSGSQGLTRSDASVGDPMDLRDGETLLATLLFAGTSSSDPVGVLPAGAGTPEVIAGLTAAFRPREQLMLRIATTEHVPWVWGGLSLVMIGLILAGLLPSYEIAATRRGPVWRLEMRVGGLIGRPAVHLETLCDGLARQVADEPSKAEEASA